MRQSRLGSLIEALINTVIGFFVSFLANLFVFPLFDIHISTITNLKLMVVRSYIIRRFFNARLHRVSQSLAGVING